MSSPTLTIGGKPIDLHGPDPLGWLSANDLPTEAPPDLLFTYLLPDKTTLMYGKGGTGKGVIAAIFAGLLTRAGRRVLILDYEDHPEEWGQRLTALTFPDSSKLSEDEKGDIIHCTPYDPERWAEDAGPLPVVAHTLRARCDRDGIDYVIVDSYSAAADDDEALGGQGAAKRFALALTKLGRPALVLAHVSESKERLPDKPFGSVHVRNLVARLMYAMAQDEVEAEPGVVGPRSIRVEMKRTKGNRYGRGPNRFIEVTFHVGGAITWDLDASGPVPALWKRLADILRAEGPQTVPALTKAVNEDWAGATTTTRRVGEALDREKTVFEVATTVRPKTWRLRGTPEEAPS